MKTTNQKDKNNKEKGEIAQRIVIGKLAKYRIDVAIPLTDNLPWDLVLIVNNKLYRTQIKSSDEESYEDKVVFSFRTGNWWKKTNKKYSEKDVDVYVCYDFRDDLVFLVDTKMGSNRNSMTIRKKMSKTGNSNKTSNMAEDYLMTQKRIEEIFV